LPCPGCDERPWPSTVANRPPNFFLQCDECETILVSETERSPGHGDPVRMMDSLVAAWNRKVKSEKEKARRRARKLERKVEMAPDYDALKEANRRAHDDVRKTMNAPRARGVR
jgi:hypothetical protein